MTALFGGAFKGNLAMVKYLVGRHVDVRHKRDDGMTALCMAKAKGNMEVAKFLYGSIPADAWKQNVRSGIASAWPSWS